MEPVFIGRHGIKESEGGPRNWDLRVTEDGVAALVAQAAALAALPQRPSRICCSPFPRCIQTAAIYAKGLGLGAVTVEPALCEVLAPHLGAKGRVEARWVTAELEVVVEEREETAGVVVADDDGAAARVVRMGELAQEDVSAESEGAGTDREQCNLRVKRLAERVRLGEFGGALLVTHGSPFRRLCDVLVLGVEPGLQFGEVPMGGIVRLDPPPPVPDSEEAAADAKWDCELLLRELEVLDVAAVGRLVAAGHAREIAELALGFTRGRELDAAEILGRDDWAQVLGKAA